MNLSVPALLLRVVLLLSLAFNTTSGNPHAHACAGHSRPASAHPCHAQSTQAASSDVPHGHDQHSGDAAAGVCQCGQHCQCGGAIAVAIPVAALPPQPTQHPDAPPGCSMIVPPPSAAHPLLRPPIA